MATIASLVEGFSASGILSTRWRNTAESFTTAAQSSGKLQLTGPVASTAGSHYATVVSREYYDLTNNGIYACAPQQVNSDSGSMVEGVMLRVEASGGNDYLQWFYSNGSLAAHKGVSAARSTVFSTTYSNTTHRWFRIRHLSADGKTYWDTAPNTASDPPVSGDWINRWSETAPIAITALFANFGAGAWSAAVVDCGTLQIDCVNCATTFANDAPSLLGSDYSQYPKPLLRTT